MLTSNGNSSGNVWKERKKRLQWEEDHLHFYNNLDDNCSVRVFRPISGCKRRVAREEVVKNRDIWLELKLVLKLRAVHTYSARLCAVLVLVAERLRANRNTAFT